MAVAPGRVVYTQMLNRNGGIEADMTVTRLAEDRYMIVTSAASATRDFNWIQRHMGAEERAVLTDATSSLGVLGVMGPKARDLLSKLTDADLSNAAFPYLSAREIDVGYGRAQALRVTYVGELGWELYLLTEQMATVYESILEAGEDLGLCHAGYHALDSLRIEKGYRHWGHDITNEDTPLEAGLGFAVGFEKNADFIGRDALLRQRDEGLARRLVQFTIDDPAPLLYHDEPIWRDGRIVGRTTSGNYGHKLGHAVGFGYVTDDGGAVTADYVREGSYEIEIAGERFAATPHLRSPYDPKSERVKA
jgi:4-methylaminobutanoate oxidase (formaldehyde-forming)